MSRCAFRMPDGKSHVVDIDTTNNISENVGICKTWCLEQYCVKPTVVLVVVVLVE